MPGGLAEPALGGGGDGVERRGIGAGVAGGVVMGLGGLAEHVEAVAPALGLLGRGALQRFVDGAAEHELAAEDLHRLPDRGADHRLAEAADGAAERGAPALGLVIGFFEHLAGQQQREGRGVDEGRAAVAHLLGPVGTGKLVGDEVVGGGGVGHAQQRFGKAHQRNAFVAAKVIGLQESVEPGGLVAAHRLDQGARDRLRFGCLPLGQARLIDPFAHDGSFVGPIGTAERGAVNHGFLSPYERQGCALPLA